MFPVVHHFGADDDLGAFPGVGVAFLWLAEFGLKRVFVILELGGLDEVYCVGRFVFELGLEWV